MPTCTTCDRRFRNANELEMHMQTHRPRNVACPLCGEQRFRSGANVVQHVEEGGCTKCSLNKQIARQLVYNYVQNNASARHLVSGAPRLEYGGRFDADEVTLTLPLTTTLTLIVALTITLPLILTLGTRVQVQPLREIVPNPWGHDAARECKAQ